MNCSCVCCMQKLYCCSFFLFSSACVNNDFSYGTYTHNVVLHELAHPHGECWRAVLSTSDVVRHRRINHRHYRPALTVRTHVYREWCLHRRRLCLCHSSLISRPVFSLRAAAPSSRLVRCWISIVKPIIFVR